MKIGVISDTHLHNVNKELTRIVEGVFKDADMILHAGDIGSGLVLDYLEGFNLFAVRGNMDGLGVADRLPNKRVVNAGPFKIGLIHGYGSPDGLAERLRNEFEGIDCLVFGHSHKPMNRITGGELWFNPGTAMIPRGSGRTVGFLHIADDAIKGEIVHLD